MKDEGLMCKYDLFKNGNPVDKNGIYFVLKLNSSDPVHANACQFAALAYAMKMKDHLPILSSDLEILVKHIREFGDSKLFRDIQDNS